MKTFCAVVFVLSFVLGIIAAAAIDFGGLVMTEFQRDSLILIGAIAFIAFIGWIHCETSER